MKKKTKVLGLAGLAAGTIYLAKSKKQKKAKDLDIDMKDLKTQYVKNLGKPSDIDDSDMVEEGALTSVQYYNRLQQKSKNL
ncbi:hypothetical protein Plano_2918 [Planococcus sp. PAMC 21323]|uniref:hypothetical protein n=1 Tax=Planococcus sp. PAMC 21323 TaxID=1526927 RepID=UPI0005718700|nr:hypothetical protein [Planococcus sp. PAMC 21323]AIY06883.1 hypothetical protein Plano_2918 [Planococcus sp. PAMC 21323]